MLPRALVIATLAGLSHQATTPRAANNETLPPLKFNENGTFQIAVFSDLHVGEHESSTGPEQDGNTFRVIRDVLSFDPPDLVVLNGDLIHGDSTYLENSTYYIDQIVAPIVDGNLTWASTYGNHDRQYNISGDSILEREHMWPGCRTQNMVNTTEAGTTNYYLPVYPANCTDGADCTPELLLWFFDSRGGLYFRGDYQPSWVDESVVTWFKQTNNALVKRYEKTIPSLAFVHIPINASKALQTESKKGVDTNYQPGINDDRPVAQQGSGWCKNDSEHQTCVYDGQDVPFMQALVSVPSLIALFYGHDHGNSWCYKWDTQLPGMTVAGNGINLCYGQHSGYGAYGDWIRGAREIVVSQELLKHLAVDTHIRLESGRVVGAVTLNATFNHDYYPVTPDEKTYMGHMTNGTIDVYLDGSKEKSSARPSRLPNSSSVAAIAWVLVACTLLVL